MNTPDQFERDLRAMLADRAPRREPATLFEAVMTGTAAVRQRPALIVGLHTGDLGAQRHPPIRLTPLFIAGVLVVALLGALLVIGASRLLPPPPAPALLGIFEAAATLPVPATKAVGLADEVDPVSWTPNSWGSRAPHEVSTCRIPNPHTRPSSGLTPSA